jgi:thiamine-monophosphate kinase
MDVSDGLLLDASRLADASKVCLELSAAAIPLAQELAGFGPGRALELALTGGEDYELLLAVPERRVNALRDASPVPLTRIGRVTKGRGVRLDGQPPSGRLGFTHV